MAKPFIFNPAALAIVPVSAIRARSASDQIDALWNAADDPLTPKDRSLALIRLINKLTAKLNKAS